MTDLLWRTSSSSTARSEGERRARGEVGITGNHVNRAAPSGWLERLVRPSCVVEETGIAEKNEADAKICVAALRACVILRRMDADAIKKLEAKLAADQEELAKNREAIRRVKNMLEGIAENTSQPSPDETAFVAVEPTSPTHLETGGRSSLGAVDDAVKWAVSEIGDVVFDSTDVQKLLESAGKHCNRTSVSAAMGRLRDKSILIVVEQGQGRRATRYKTA